MERIVLPTSYRRKVFEIAHSVPMAGHLGQRKTAYRVLQRFYWPNVMPANAQEGRGPATGVPLPIVDEPLRRMAMNIVGPLDRSKSGNHFILVICDYATRYPEAIPLKSVEADHIAEELVKLFARVGIPEEILTDQGTNFTAQLLKELYRMLGVHAIKTTPYHPQTDGLVERFNGALKGTLRQCAREDRANWDQFLPYLLFAYREVPQESTGFSPFELLYGRRAHGPLDVLKEQWEART